MGTSKAAEIDKGFPIHPYSMKGEQWFPRSIPWSAAEQFRSQAERNHGQTLERLAQRGGLSPEEIYDAYMGQRLSFGKLSPSIHLAALALVVKLAAPPVAERNSHDRT